MSESYFHKNYPKEIPPTIDPSQYENIIEIFDEFCHKYGEKPAFSCMGQTLTYNELNQKSAHFAAYLQQETSVQPGDRIAIQLPNILQFPVVVFGAIRAGAIVVNTNPLYTEREMEHQFNDAGVKLLVVYAAMAKGALNVVPKTKIEKVLVTEIADLHKPLKRILINTIVKKVKKMVPEYDAGQVIPLRSALRRGANHQFNSVERNHSDIAVLQYTGGTTGLSKGAILTHKNLVANMMQGECFFEPPSEGESEIVIAPLPLYHIYAFLVNCLLLLKQGSHNVLIPNPRDIPGFVKELAKWKFGAFFGLNTLFVALMNNQDFQQLDFSALKTTGSGGMALTSDVADRWEKMTGCPIREGYGLTETSPIVSTNPASGNKLGTIGIPIPSTEVKTIDDQGNDTAKGEPGELCVRGPQVMRGYWNNPEETANAIDSDGWLQTGDIAAIGDDGYLKIVDRKKDMIIVSGFNVYPNEVEDILVSHPKVLEAAAIGIPNEKTGEAICIYLVTNGEITDDELISHCKESLTSYKVPKQFIRKTELPKTNVGKILRRALRDEAMAS